MILPDQPRRKLAAIGERDDDFFRPPDHMVVGDDDAGRIDDEAGTRAHAAFAAIAEAAAELAAHRGVAQFGRKIAVEVAALRGLDHRDVDDRRQDFLDEGREAFGGAPGDRGATVQQQHGAHEREAEDAGDGGHWRRGILVAMRRPDGHGTGERRQQEFIRRHS